jgi:hypothetical protein
MSILGFSASFTGYRGVDPQTAYAAKAIFPGDDNGAFRIELVPYETTTWAAGIDLMVPIGPARVWADAAVFSSRFFANNTLSPETLQTGLETAPAIDAVVGASLEFPLIELTLFAEYRKLAALTGDRSPLRPGYLSSIVVTQVSWRLFDSLTIEESLAISTGDMSLLSVTSIAFAPDDQVAMQVMVPIAYGNKTSEFGQFTDHRRLYWSLAFRL